MRHSPTFDILIGAGTHDDPKRPLVAPKLSDLRKPGAIQSFSYQLSDEGQQAATAVKWPARVMLVEQATQQQVLFGLEDRRVVVARSR